MRTVTHSEVLWSRIQLAEGRLLSVSHRFWTHPQLADVLPDFLVQLHRVMRGGIILMRVARDRALMLDNDEVAAIAARYLDTHIAEEGDHEAWLLDDIGTLGIPPADVLRANPLSSVISLLGAQYFWALNIHPVTVFGYLIVLEGYPPLSEQLEAIRVRTGLPATAFRCLQAHADNDPHHIADLNHTLDQLPLSSEQQKFIALSALHTIDSVASVFEEFLGRLATCDEAAQALTPSHA